MYYMILPTTATFLAATVGKDLLSKGISNASDRICKSIVSLSDNNYRKYDVKIVLEELDLYAKISVINAILEDVKYDSKSVNKALSYLHHTLEQLDSLLGSINEEINYHKSKWFSSYRTINIDSLIHKLISLNKILDARLNRFKLAVQFENINEHWCESNHQKINN